MARKVAHEVGEGEIVRIDGRLHRVVATEQHRGIGQQSGVAHLKLRALPDGAVSERRFKWDDRIDAPEIELSQMEFLYASGAAHTFMDASTFEQVELDGSLLGRYAAYLRPNEALFVERLDGVPVAVRTPASATVRVVSTSPGLRGDTEAGFKPAQLENGREIQVPQFVDVGDLLRVEIETGRYVERIRESKA